MTHALTDIDWLAALAATGLAFVVGALGYFMRVIDAGQPVKPSLVGVHAASSGVAGFLVLMLCDAGHIRASMTMFAIGMSGWLGVTPTFQLLQQRFLSMFGPAGRNNDADPSP